MEARFYANFSITAIAPWSANPTIDVLVSNDPSLATSGSTTASYAAYNGSTSVAYVPVPDYTVDSGSTTAAAVVDDGQKVTVVSGVIALAFGSQPSTGGCVWTTTEPTQTNAGIVSAFQGGTPCPNSGDESWATPYHT